ncbi:MAG: hypothetical protein IKY83_05115 [Proteobacteria bacterium]|nr:hypothetical protein [Pseudomonadota bacterium]
MRRFFYGMMTVTIFAGCAEGIIVPSLVQCSATCDETQVCLQDKCYDTCSLNKPCPLLTQSCQNNLCIDGDAICTPDTRKCSSDGLFVLICRGGAYYDTEKACTAEQTCENGACVNKACENGTYRCHNNNVQYCMNNSYIDYSICSAPQVCSEVTRRCEIPAECTGTAKKCKDGDIYICSDSHWISYQACPTGQACNATTLKCEDTSVCNNGDTKCSDNQLQICQNAKWNILQSCTDAQICDSTARTCRARKCQDGEQICAENGGRFSIQTCQNNDYIQYSVCQSGEICTEENGTPKCVINQCTTLYRCENNTLYRCANNELTEVKSCPAGTTCDVASADCRSNCNNGILDTGEDCDGILFREGLTCSSKIANSVGDLKCTKDCSLDISGCTQACTEGASVCENNQFKQCIASKWVTTDCGIDKQCAASGCYTPSFSGNWDYVQTFEIAAITDKNTTARNTYATDYDFVDKDGYSWKIKARTNMVEKSESYAIDETGIILKADKSTYIQVKGIATTIGRLAFDWRSWGGNNDKGTLHIKVNDTIKSTLKFTKAETTVSTHQIDIQGEVTSLEFVLDNTASGEKSGRLVIDNIRWNYIK